MNQLILQNGKENFLTTESTVDFDKKSILFLGKKIRSNLLEI